MEWIKTILNAVRVAVDNTLSKIELLNTKTRTLEDDSKSMQRNIQKLSNNLATTQSEVSDISQSVEKVSKRVNSQETTVSRLSSSVTNLAGQLNKKLDVPSFLGYYEDYLTQTPLGPRWYPVRRTIPVSSWADVQSVVRSGKAAETYRLGDRFVCNHSEFGQLTWDIIGFDQDTPTDNQYTHSMTLLLHFFLNAYLYWDAKEPSNPEAEIQKYGSNRWKESAIRQWLNSSAGAGEWWTAQTEYDTKPDNADSQAGFIFGLDPEFYSVIGSVEKQTASSGLALATTDITSDKFFFLSNSEVLFNGFNDSEGIRYQYFSTWSDRIGKGLSSTDKSGDPNAIRIRYLDWTDRLPMHPNNSWTLRSPTMYKLSQFNVVSSTGGISRTYGGTASGGGYPIFACCIV